MDSQQTIKQDATIAGRGLFTGEPATVTIKPAPTNHGVAFLRTDLDEPPIPALVANVVKRERRTALEKGKASVDTCEHILSALAGLGVDNALIEIDGPEVPGVDGSAEPFATAIEQAGLQKQDATRKTLKIREPVVAEQDGAVVAAMPSDEGAMQVLYELDYGEHPVLSRQVGLFNLGEGEYTKQIAPSRTFLLEEEAKALRAAGVGTHLEPNDIVVIGDAGPIGGNAFRFDDEPVRHKILDLIGDLYLLGAPIEGRIIAYRSGHSLNHLLVRKLMDKFRAQLRTELAARESVFDIRRLSRILPHRYPMLLIDRVVEIRGQEHAVGIKNVTMNEPFFQGHYPGTPIMPGVLIVESMAQLSGVLINQNLEHTGKLAVLLSLDRVKLRKPVVPGDQMVLEADAVRVRTRLAHMRCRAYVDSDVVAEAEVKFMLVDDERES